MLFVGEGFIEQLPDLLGEPGGQLQGAVVVEDGLSDHRGGQVREIADGVLSASAQEVAVAGAVASAGFGVDQA
ncbi:hypothetical protein [Nocardia sp. NPDC057227]|uniref:hypothetical protein n=1 Tax=Nocardia sp. NPDC057227 TaxID=3346056 RepID=UPI00363DEE55